MSKKKAFSGNTMTLKDFHGGSIPTDLPLPSAPGINLRSADASGYDRPNSWGGSVGRPDQRVRPNSSPATRHLDDRTPFLSHTVRIGRNFDEDERKPLDGVPARRQTVSDESFQVPLSGVELKPEPVVSGRGLGQAFGAQFVNSYSGRVSEGAHMGASLQNVGGHCGQIVGGSSLNAWAARKEMGMGVHETVQSAWSSASAVSKLAHASALEKVSSGRWQTKQSIHFQMDVEVVEHLETEKSFGSRGYDDHMYNRMDAMGGKEYSDVTLARHMERGLAMEDGIQAGKKEFVNHDKARVPLYLEFKERSPSIHDDGVQPNHTNGKFGGSQLQPLVQSEASERPRVKLLPRTKPLENLELLVVDHKQGHQHPSESAYGHVEASNERHVNVNVNAAKPGLACVETQNQAVERPKLNLKPRSHPLEQSEGNSRRERIALFGGARPREVVLKERGIDDATVSNHDLGQHLDRIKHNVPKTERVPEHGDPTCHGVRTDNLPLDQRTGKKSERKDLWADSEQVDMQRRIWHKENWRNSRETERQQQSQQERPPSLETWCKPVEEPKPASLNASGLRYGKTASALELAQAFSKSFSDPQRYSGQRGLPGNTQMPFSRLMGPTPRPQINGY